MAVSAAGWGGEEEDGNTHQNPPGGRGSHRADITGTCEMLNLSAGNHTRTASISPAPRKDILDATTTEKIQSENKDQSLKEQSAGNQVTIALTSYWLIWESRGREIDVEGLCLETGKGGSGSMDPDHLFRCHHCIAISLANHEHQNLFSQLSSMTAILLPLYDNLWDAA